MTKICRLWFPFPIDFLSVTSIKVCELELHDSQTVCIDFSW